MAITRRQFVTRLGALAAATGMSQANVSAITEALAGNSSSATLGLVFNKPRVIWIHGAECTGCSTSLLGLLEDANGLPFKASGDSTTTTGAALGLAKVTNAFGGAFPTLGGATRTALYGDGTSSLYGSTSDELVDIADVVIDVIDLQYHETVMGMGGDLAAKWLDSFIRLEGDLHSDEDYMYLLDGVTTLDQYGTRTAAPFILVVEGAMQDKREKGAWNETHTNQSWCSIGMSSDYGNPLYENVLGGNFYGLEFDMAETVAKLAALTNCALVIPVGQCACYGGYPACKPQITSAEAGFNATVSQTGAKGAYDFLNEYTSTDTVFQGKVNAAKDKVVAVPGCPTNPWWFVLTVVMAAIDLVNPSHPLGVLGAGGLPDPAAVDYGRRLKKVYPVPVHSVYCPRYKSYAAGVFALKPGDPGCLQKLGCKGVSTQSLCGTHGWNNQQPQNAGSLSSLNGGRGGQCTAAGHPCMGCTEKGYPDTFVPFVKR